MNSALGILLAAALAAPTSTPPAPPQDLGAWVTYARELLAGGPRCPPDRMCVQLQRAELSGRVDAGRVTLVVSGENLGREVQALTVVGPAQSIAVVASRYRQGSGAVRLEGGAWQLEPRPGPFTVELELSFAPAPSVPVELPQGVARVVDALSGGRVAFDESSDRHGGLVFLESTTQAKSEAEPVTVRAARVFKWSSVVTFTYRFSMHGVREQTRLTLPMVGGESVEAVSPDVPYTVGAEGLTVTVSAGASDLEVSGHFAAAPAAMKKPAALPFEQWVLEVDARHPVELGTDGVEIDPGEVTGIQPGPRARAFFLIEQQTLSVTPVAVHVDKGRQGSGTARLEYRQGKGDGFVGTLFLNATSAPESDRLDVPTPATPHYAELGGTAVRLFGHGGVLSLRHLSDDDQLLPIRVQWREHLDTNPLLSVLTLALPPQGLQLEQEEVAVALLPGYVPMAVLGAESAEGHLVDGLHIYAILLAALAVALARAARFPRWALVITGVLFVGLYTVEGFPRTALLVLLAGCALWVQLPERGLVGLKQSRFLHAVVVLSWLVVLAVAVIPSALYVRERLLSALHPWSDAALTSTQGFANIMQTPDLGAMGGMAGDMPEPEPEQEAQAQAPREEVQVKKQQVQQQERRLSKQDVATLKEALSSQSYARKVDTESLRAAEKTIRPVAFEGSTLPANLVTYRFGSLLPGDVARARVLVAGPWLRGLWMILESAGVLLVVGLLVLRGRRIFGPAAGPAGGRQGVAS